jgi:membrane protein
MLIVVVAMTPSRSHDAAKSWLIGQTHLSGEAAAAVQQLFGQPPGVGTTTALGVALLIFSVLGFTRTLQRTFLAAWRLPSSGLKGFGYGLLGAAVLVAEVTALVLMAPILSRLPGGLLLTLAVQTIVAGLLWWPVQRLLLGPRVAWRGLLPGAVVAGIGQIAVTVASGVYLPVAIGHEAARYGLIGVAFVLVTWLIGLGLLLVIAAALSAEVARAPGPSQADSPGPHGA